VLGKAAPIIGGIFGGLQIAEGVAALNSGDTNKGVLKIASGGIDLACVGMLAAGPLGWIAAGVIQIGKFIGENWGDQIIEGVKGFAGAAGKAIGDFADGAGKFLGDVGKGVGDFFGGIGKALTGG